MFDLKTLRQDKELNQFCRGLIPSYCASLGRYVEIQSVDQLLERLTMADYERIKFLPYRQQAIYRTRDLGVGYIDYLSIYDFQQFIALNLVQKEIPVYVDYRFGNSYSYVKSTDLDTRILLTDETYLFVKEETQEIWDIKIGKPTNPNRLYNREDLDRLVMTSEQAMKIERLNSLYIEEQRDSLL